MSVTAKASTPFAAANKAASVFHAFRHLARLLAKGERHCTNGSPRLARVLEARIEGKLDPHSAGFPHDEMDLWAGARGFRTELDDNAGPA